MAEEKTVTTTAVETGEKPEAAEGTTQEKPEAVAKTYDQAYVDDLIERQKAAQEAAVAEALKVARHQREKHRSGRDTSPKQLWMPSLRVTGKAKIRQSWIWSMSGFRQ